MRQKRLDVENGIKFFAGGSIADIKMLEKKLIIRILKEHTKILKELGLVTKTMKAADALSMVGDLGSTWYTYRAWGR